MLYRTILADPPWPQELAGPRRRRGNLAQSWPYPLMTMDQIKALDVGAFAETGCHLWLWTSNAFPRAGFDVLDAWGFHYLAPITWHKPSGVGNYFAHTTQTILFAYFKKCQFNLARYLPTDFAAHQGKHSTKPEKSFTFIERISDPPRLEMFARRKRPGWDCWGNEVESDITLEVS